MTLKSLISKDTDFELKTLGDHIRKRRLILDITQKQAATLLGVTGHTVLHWENGPVKPANQYIPALIQFLGYDPEPALCTTLSEQLAARRRELGWSRKMAARKLGVDPATWTNWEHGAPIIAMPHRRRVAKFLGISWIELYAAA
ncbi:MAG: helix-turn-helix domain-containing protein [Acidimicrobiales bacterium]